MPTDNSGGPVNLSQGAAAVGRLPGNTALNSSEQIFSPIIIGREPSGGSELIPGFEQARIDPQSLGSFYGLSLNPTVVELSPYFTNIINDDWIAQCDFQVAYNDGTGENGADANIRKVNRSSINNVVVNHLRGPLILAGWGFDHGDRAAPNDGSDAFTHDPDVVNDRSTWKAGPIDLKWDEVWKVWGAGHHMVCGIVQGEISAPEDPCRPTQFTIKVLRNSAPTALPTAINCDQGDQLIVYNRDPSLAQEAVQGLVFCVAARINYEYIPIWVGCPEPPDEPVSPECCS